MCTGEQRSLKHDSLMYACLVHMYRHVLLVSRANQTQESILSKTDYIQINEAFYYFYSIYNAQCIYGDVQVHARCKYCSNRHNVLISLLVERDHSKWAWNSACFPSKNNRAQWHVCESIYSCIPGALVNEKRQFPITSPAESAAAAYCTILRRVFVPLEFWEIIKSLSRGVKRD